MPARKRLMRGVGQHKEARIEMVSQEHMLRAAFIAGAVTDALALVPMVVAPAAKLLWGFDDASGVYRFAMGYAASRMAPTWGMQAVLLALFGVGYCYPALRRKATR